MKEIYEWLYDEYAEAALCQEPLFQDHVLEEVLAAAPEDIRLGLFDQVACVSNGVPRPLPEASSWAWPWEWSRGRRRTTAPDRSSAPSRRQG